ncbi:MAG: ABC transporter permease, partial [Polyangiaceae bacterium]|nr:ABC transporter permease [Polyangiaceae bacterium]
MRRLFAIAWKELLQLKRDRLSLGMVVALPIVQLLLFGYAIDTDVKHIPTVVYDQDRSPGSRTLAQTIASTQYIDLVGSVDGYEQVERSLRGGQAEAALIIPPKMQSDVVESRPVDVQFIVNGVDPQIVASALGAVEGVTADVARRISWKKLDRQGVELQQANLTLVPLVKYNPDRRSAVFIV